MAGEGGRQGGERDRPLLRDGPRQPLGPDQAGDGRAVGGKAEGRHTATGEEAVRAAYERDETDEFIKPTLVGERARIEPGDVVIFFNFRPDRARQLTQALNTEMDLHYTTLTEYREDWDYPVAFPPERPRHHPGRDPRAARPRPAARGGDREVPARDLLLQRRGGGRPRGRAALPRRLAARCPDLRPQAGDERARGRRGLHRALGGGGLRLRDHQLREPRHGRPHGRDPGGCDGGRDGGRVPRAGGGGREAKAASAS